MKSIALFSAGPAKWKLSIKDFDGYIEVHKKSERLSLKPVQVILVNHGGKGVLEIIRPGAERRISAVLMLRKQKPKGSEQNGLQEAADQLGKPSLIWGH